MHLLMSGTLTLLLAMRISNQRARRSCSRLVHVYPLISLDFSEAVEMATAQSASALNPELIEFDYDGIRMDADRGA